MKGNESTSQAEAELLEAATLIEQHLRSIRNVRRRAQTNALKVDMDQMRLTRVQIQVMEILTRLENSAAGISLKELSSQMGLAHSTTSGIVDRLERQGLLHRIINPNDRRQIRIQVVEEVRDFMVHTWPRINLASFVRALEVASNSERARILEGLSILDRLLTETNREDTQRARS